MKSLHLICNAHLDPVWLWEWEEGAAETLSTFRVAADFCEEFDGFIFNHNEVILYKWIEEYEPALFKRIQRLVAEGKWHIMGGWYLQPDCNMPSGESFVRQILLGRTYFNEKFGVQPTTAINFDPFGHTRGLVQIMKKSGYDSYIFCRPGQSDCPLPADDFMWVGYDQSEIMGHRAADSYLSARGEAHSKVQHWIDTHPDKPNGLVLWGVGNHGGGPSRVDLANLQEMIDHAKEHEIIHSTPEAYFEQQQAYASELPRHEKDLNLWAPGCYTSQVRIKQKHRLLENEYYMVEKMLSSAAIQSDLAYPARELHEALCDLMTAEFHDILPGSSIQPVEETSLRLLDHGLEILSRLKARAFFSLASGQQRAEEGEIPVFIYNPHPHEVEGVFECEFQLPDQNWDESKFYNPVMYHDGVPVICQTEKELSNLNLDWRKRVAFQAKLLPSQMNRFDCKIEVLAAKPKPHLQLTDGHIHFTSKHLEVLINTSTGLMDRYCAEGIDYLQANAFQPFVIADDDDAWGSAVHGFPNQAGSFVLMNKEQGTRFSGIVNGQVLDSVRVVEDGDVRAVIEALFMYGDSFIVLTYKLPKHGTEVQVHVRVHWNEKTKMLKLSIPSVIHEGKYLGQVAYGTAELPADRTESVAHKWTGVFSEKNNRALTCINDGIYGSDMMQGEIRLSLIRSPGYSALTLGERALMPQDRYLSRIDQGERQFQFWLNAGGYGERLEAVDREAMAHNEKPFPLSFFPSGEGKKLLPLIELSDQVVLMTAFKKSERGDDYMIRLFEPTGAARSTEISLPAAGLKFAADFEPFEIKTYQLNLSSNKVNEVGLMEV